MILSSNPNLYVTNLGAWRCAVARDYANRLYFVGYDPSRRIAWYQLAYAGDGTDGPWVEQMLPEARALLIAAWQATALPVII